MDGSVLMQVLVHYAQLVAAHLAGEDIVALAVFHHGCAVNDDRLDSWRMAAHFLRINRIGQLLADQIIDLIGVEYRNISRHAFFQDAAIETEPLCRKAGYFVHRLF